MPAQSMISRIGGEIALVAGRDRLDPVVVDDDRRTADRSRAGAVDQPAHFAALSSRPSDRHVLRTRRMLT